MFTQNTQQKWSNSRLVSHHGSTSRVLKDDHTPFKSSNSYLNIYTGGATGPQHIDSQRFKKLYAIQSQMSSNQSPSNLQLALNGGDRSGSTSRIQASNIVPTNKYTNAALANTSSLSTTNQLDAQIHSV